jgi:hypothetical protein
MTSQSNFRCQNDECDKEYTSYNNLLRHYQVNSQHKPENLETKKKPNAMELVCDVLLPKHVSEGSRSARIKAFLSCLSVEEVKEHFILLATDHLSPWELLLSKATMSNGSVNTAKLSRKFNTLHQLLLKTYPEMKPLCKENAGVSAFGITTLNDMVKFVVDNKKLACEAIVEAENGRLFRELLMPFVYEKYKASFVEFASGIVGSFSLGQKQLQDVLQNTWGKHLSQVLGLM